MTRRVAVLGAGGHAKVVVAALRAMGREVIGCYVRDPAALRDDAARSLLGVAVRAEDTLPAGVALVVAVGDNTLRSHLATKFAGPWETVVHPSAIVDPTVVLDEGAMICAGAVLQVDVHVREHAIVNTSAHLDHDCVVGAFVHVAPGCHVAGDVAIDEGALLGIGASVIQGRSIGAWSIVGAGAVVVRDVFAGTTVIGVPARPLAAKTSRR